MARARRETCEQLDDQTRTHTHSWLSLYMVSRAPLAACAAFSLQYIYASYKQLFTVGHDRHHRRRRHHHHHLLPHLPHAGALQRRHP